MQLTVIGCSPAWPNAGGAQSGYLVEGEGRLLLDCGPGVLARLRKLDGGWPRVDAVAITHFHLDHWGDLVPWIFGASFGPGREVPTPELWLPPGRDRPAPPLRRPDELLRADRRRLLRPRVRGGNAVSRRGLRRDRTPARALLRAHVRPPRVSNHRSTLAYSGDTGPSEGSPSSRATPTSFSARRRSREPEPAERGHLSEDEAVEAFRASGARRLVVIHRPTSCRSTRRVERAADGDVLTF